MRDPDQVNEGNPFPGLRPFEMEEYHLFFGRDGQSEEVLRRLHNTRFVAVVGTSGSGKSSLIRAGLLPALYGGLMAGTGSLWRVVLMRPGHDPLGNLAYELVQGGVVTKNPDPDIQNTLVETTLRRSTLGLVDAVRQAGIVAGENVLVVVDQFEELFRFKEANKHTTSSDEAGHFVKLLIAASAQKEVPIYVVMTMRSDFLGDCSQFTGLPEAINESQYLIPRMTRDEREAAIKGPIRVADGKITVPLVNRLLNDVGDSPDQLPILQHALMRTWDHWSAHRRNGEAIGIDDYEAIGTMDAALSSHANEALAELKTAKNVSIAEKLFKRLCERGTDNRETRRPTRMGEICEVAKATLAEVTAVVDVFRRKGRSFLMPPEEVELTVDSIVDISHESLIRVWDRLREWTARESDSARMYRRLSAATTDFGATQLPDSLLDAALEWRELQKPNAAWAERYRRDSEGDPTFDEVMSFIDESKKEREENLKKLEEAAEDQRRKLVHEKEQAEILAKQQLQIAETERKVAASERDRAEQAHVFAQKQASAARKLRFLVAALFFLLIVAVGAMAIAIKSRRMAESSEKKALAAAEVAEKAQRRAEAESARADDERDRAKESAEVVSAANEKLRATKKDLEQALYTAKTAQAATREKEAESAQLRQYQQDLRDANQDFRDGADAIDVDKAAESYFKAGPKFELLKESKLAGDSYLRGANIRANISTADDLQIQKAYDDAIKNFHTMSNAEAIERNAGQERAAQAHVAKGEYLSNTLWRVANDKANERFSLGIQSLEEGLKLYEVTENVKASINTLSSIASRSKDRDKKKSVDALNRTRKFYTTKEDWLALRQLLLDLAIDDQENRKQYLDEMLKFSKEHNDPQTDNQTVMEVATFYVRQMASKAELEAGIALYEQALTVVNQDLEKADRLTNFAYTLRTSGREEAKEKAGNYYKRALDIYLALKNQESTNYVLVSFFSADGPDALRLWPEAFDYMEKYLKLAEEKEKLASQQDPANQQDPAAQRATQKERALFLFQFGAARKSLGQFPQALEATQRAAKILEVLPEYGVEEASAHMEIGNLQIQLKADPASALQSFKRAQELYHVANKPDPNNPCYAPPFYLHEADAFAGMGSVQAKLNQLSDARISYTEALELYKKVFAANAQVEDMIKKISGLEERTSKP